MANKNITVMLDMLMNTSNVNSGIGQIRQQLKTLKLPSNLQDSFRKSFSDLDDGVSKIQRRLNSGFKNMRQSGHGQFQEKRDQLRL